MKFIDMHCDTLMQAYRLKKDDIYEMPGMLDIKRMKEGGSLAQFFAIFMLPPGVETRWGLDKPVEDLEYISTSIATMRNTAAKHSDCLAMAYSAKDVEANEKAGKMSALLTFEDGRTIDGNMDNLKKFYDEGIRLISLTWNAPNCFGFPNSKDPEIMSKGLTDFGKEAIGVMNDLGILIDVSHLSDGGFMDVAALSKKPFVASHSNCRALSPHQRNMTDEMIRIMAEKGGVAGINFGPEFLNEDITRKESTVDLMVKHIDRMIQLGGTGCVAMGSDFDGIHGEMEVPSIDKMGLIFDRLAKKGYSEDVVEQVAWKNAMRVMHDAL